MNYALKPALLAAQELQLWIREISGAELPIVESATGKHAVVVKLALKPAEFPQDTQAIGETDGYAVRPTANGLTLFRTATSERSSRKIRI